MQAAKKHILDKFKGKVTEEGMEESFSSLQQRYVQSSETTFSKFGLYLKDKILVVPEHVLLPEDAAHSSNPAVGGAELTAARERFDLLCQRAREAKVKRAMLTSGRDALRELLHRQEKALKNMRALKERTQVKGGRRRLLGVSFLTMISFSRSKTLWRRRPRSWR